jgi:deoxyribodipyrimidine photo-lyase
MVFHIFRRDLRLADNTALAAALKEGPVLPLFFRDPRQNEDNPLAGAAALACMNRSLAELDDVIGQRGGRLYVIEGTPEDMLPGLFGTFKPSALYLNRDYTPFSRSRDGDILRLCRDHGVRFESRFDTLLADPEVFRAKKPYRVFTPFFKSASQLPVRPPSGEPGGSFFKGDLPAAAGAGPVKGLRPLLTGGRTEALRLLESASRLTRYETTRDYPAVPGTSRLSAPLKFGTVSVREVHRAVTESLGPDHPLIRQLWWRDFFTHVLWHFPHVMGHPFNDRFRNLEWTGTPDQWQRFITGTTGFPLVDAGIRELLATGGMHNRVRMVTASFLVKDLHIDWRQGELFFARYLQDYDPALNNGNWQWAASTGCDAQPWFRIFNPWLQQKRFDPGGEYVKRWVPELENVPPAELHKPEGVRAGYPRPMVDHKTESARALSFYKACPGS